MTQAPTLEPLWSAQDLADYLDVPIGTVYYQRSRSDGPPAIRVGKHLRYRPSDVKAWLDAKSEK